MLRVFYRVDADLLLGAAEALKAHNTVLQRKQRIVAADADVRARMDFRAALPNQNVACEGKLPIGTLGAEALAFRIAAVLGGTHSLFMSKKLKIEA